MLPRDNISQMLLLNFVIIIRYLKKCRIIYFYKKKAETEKFGSKAKQWNLQKS